MNVNGHNNKFDKQKYDKMWQKEHYTQINFNVPKEKQYKEQLKLLSIGTNKSINQLLIEAIDDLFVKYDKALTEQQTDK